LDGKVITGGALSADKMRNKDTHSLRVEGKGRGVLTDIFWKRELGE
jgi:hypothetical protein